MLILLKQWGLQRLKARLLICKLLSVSILTTSCAHTGKPVASLCLLDFQAKMCWVDRGHGTGFTFAEMEKNQDSFSWFGINEFDLERIHAKLNE